MYIPSPKRFMDTLGSGPASSVALGMMRAYLRVALADGGVDETWYCATYPDVAEAISRGECPSAHEHFCDHGFFEHRRPRVFDVDEAWYARRYRDVYADVRRGAVRSPRDHFNDTGWLEGRAPSAEEMALVARWNGLMAAHRVAAPVP